jgi:hypothetical protein
MGYGLGKTSFMSDGDKDGNWVNAQKENLPRGGFFYFRLPGQ